MKTKDAKITGIPGCETVGVHPILRVYFGYCLTKAALKHRILLSERLSKYKLVTPQLGILKLLEVLGPTSQITIGQEMHVDKASMVKFIDGLEKLKYVRRATDTKDRRIKLVELTPKGLSELKVLADIRQVAEDDFLAPLNAKEKSQLRELIAKLI